MATEGKLACHGEAKSTAAQLRKKAGPLFYISA